MIDFQEEMYHSLKSSNNSKISFQNRINILANKSGDEVVFVCVFTLQVIS